ncbi:MAG TPA: MFS transporter [Acidimicrobiales bacterium]|nr:MFS transporter [Acidimicrobiales bacterium]
MVSRAGVSAQAGSRPVDRAAAGLARPRLALATLSLVLFLTFLDNTVVSVTLADVQSSLHVGVGALQWVVNGYALVFAAFMLSFGTLGDLLGRKAVMLGGVVVFCAGSVVAAVAPDSATLIAGRVVMGLGAAASEPGTLSMIRHLYTDRRDRARALGVWTAVSGLALAFGPVIGGVLVGVWSWRAVFWFNLAFGLVALAGASVVLPENSDPGNRRMDVRGSLIGAVSLAAATFAVIEGETAGYRAARIDALFAVAAAGVVAFVLVERRASNPVLDLRCLRRPDFAGANVVAFAAYFATFCIFFFVSLYLQLVGTTSGYGVALDFVPMAAALVIASVFSGRWVAVSGPRMPMVFGCLATAAGVALTEHYLRASSDVATIGWTLALAGIGIGTAMVPATSTPLSVVPPEHSGMAASATNTSRELGGVAGVAILGSIVNGKLVVDLVHELARQGFPRAIRDQVVAAVTTGNISQQAAAYSHLPNKAVQTLVARLEALADGAFRSGLNLSLWIACALMVTGAVVALLTVRTGRPAPALDREPIA